MRILIASGDSAIGSALAHHYQQQGHEVVCTTRKCHPDNSNYLDVRERRWQPTGQKFDRVVFTIAHDAPKKALDLFEVNVVGAFDWLDLVARQGVNPNAQMVVMTSQFGSIGGLSNQQAVWYRMSKAALNMGVALLQKRHPTLRWMCLHPGLVESPMTKNLKYSHSKITPEKSAEYISAFIATDPVFGFYDATTGKRLQW
jgi:NAD(P)-dependent dehydrogenase (short-subunit alcohol dehydrogenase family)